MVKRGKFIYKKAVALGFIKGLVIAIILVIIFWIILRRISNAYT